MFRRVVYCSGGLYAVQGGYMLFRGIICCSGGSYDKEKKIMMILVVTNVIASRMPERPLTRTPTAHANLVEIHAHMRTHKASMCAHTFHHTHVACVSNYICVGMCVHGRIFCSSLLS